MKKDSAISRGESRIASETGRSNLLRSIDPSGRYERLGYWLLTLDEVLGWYENVEYQGHSLKKKEDQWILIVFIKRKKERQVCFIVQDTPLECIMAFAYEVSNRRARWRPDRYA